MEYPFCPSKENTVTLNCTTTVSAATTSPVAAGTHALLLTNGSATANVFFNIGTSTVTASTSASIPIRPGEELLISLNGIDTYVAAITSNDDIKLYITPGHGLCK